MYLLKKLRSLLLSLLACLGNTLSQKMKIIVCVCVCVSIKEDICWSNAREDYSMPEENKDREPFGANRRGQCEHGAASV